MKFASRLQSALRASATHLLLSVMVAALAALMVFGLWYPFPYRELAGGRELFVLVVSVDVVCGPLLTLVLFSPQKSRSVLWRDLGLVALVQITALGYGLHTVWQVRPLFLVQEIDRFKVINATMVDPAALAALPKALRPALWQGPQVIALRAPIDAKEREKILFESVQGGRDYGERPEFYVAYEGLAALKSLQRAKPLTVFLQKRPEQTQAAATLAAEKSTSVSNLRYLPIIARQDWVAVLDAQGQIKGFLQGDGF